MEGGEVLRKVQATLDDCNLKDGALLIVEIVDKIPQSASSQALIRARRSAKEEPKIPLTYVIRNNRNES